MRSEPQSVEQFLSANQPLINKMADSVKQRMRKQLPSEHQTAVDAMDLNDADVLISALKVQALYNPAVEESANKLEGLLSYKGEREHSNLVSVGHTADFEKPQQPSSAHTSHKGMGR